MEDNSKFINDIITKCIDLINPDDIEKFRMALIELTQFYSITTKETALVPYNNFIPPFYKAYIVSKKIEGKSMKTLSLYNFYLTKFFNMVQKPVGEITADTVRLFLYSYQATTGIAGVTLDTLRACLSAFFAWANAEGYIPSNPMISVKPIKYEKKLRGYLTPIEIESMRNACENSREKAIFEFFCSTGCRVSEVLGVKISDINMNTKECDVLGKGNKHRKVYISPKCELALRDYLKETNRRLDSEGFLFINQRNVGSDHVSKETLERFIKKLAERAGIDKRVFPHLLRHTVATSSLQKGLSVEQVQKLLGHTSIATTSIYTHISDEEVKHDYLKSIV